MPPSPVRTRSPQPHPFPFPQVRQGFCRYFRCRSRPSRGRTTNHDRKTAMPLIMWGPKLCVGIKDIDDQHKKLVEIVNKLNDAMVAGHGREVIGPTLGELIRYTQRHFADEERLMARHQYEHTVEHKAQHAKL